MRTHCGGNIADMIMFPKCVLVSPRTQHLCLTQILCPGHQKCFWKSSETFLVSAWHATMLPCFATDGQHRRTQCCHHSVLVLPGPYRCALDFQQVRWSFCESGHTLLYSTLLHSTPLCYSTTLLLYSTLLYSTPLHSTLLLYYSTLLYSTPLHSTTLLYSTPLHSTNSTTPLHSTLLLYYSTALLLYYSTLLYSTLLYSTLLYSTLLYSTLLYSTLLYSTLLYSTLLYSTLLYSTLLYPINSENLNVSNAVLYRSWHDDDGNKD